MDSASASASTTAANANISAPMSAEQLQSQVLGPLSVMSSGFSDALAQPLKKSLPKTYSIGYSGAPRAFFNDLMTNQGRGVLECGSVAFNAPDGTACAYAATLSLMIVIGVLIPLLSVVYCFFFACGRMSQRCSCMGSCCGQVRGIPLIFVIYCFFSSCGHAAARWRSIPTGPRALAALFSASFESLQADGLLVTLLIVLVFFSPGFFAAKLWRQKADK